MENKKFIQEWIKQSLYDLETAQAMFKTGRYIYCVFMCHLSLEKMLKGLYFQKLNKIPLKIHSLVYFVQIQNLILSEKTNKFLEDLEEVSVPTRYPEGLDQLLKVYDKKKTQVILSETKEAWECLKKEFVK